MNGFKKAIFLITTTLILNVAAYACACVLPELKTSKQIRQQLQKYADSAEVIFEGEVVALDRLTVKFNVANVWKGEDKTEITMATGVKLTRDGQYLFSSCDYEFKPGLRYIIFAKVVDGVLKTSQCTGSTEYKNDETTASFLAKLQQKNKARKK